MAGEDLEEWANLIGTELNGYALLPRPSHLIPNLSVEASPEDICAAARKLEQHRDLSMGHGEGDRKWNATTQFEQLDVVTPDESRAVRNQGRNPCVIAEWATVVHERH
jgi:hypothetical protein